MTTQRRKAGFAEQNSARGRLYMFAVSSFGKEKTPVCEYGHTEIEARRAAKKWLVKGERLGALLEIDGCLV